MFIDLHNHIDMYSDDDIPAIIDRAKSAGVNHILVAGVNPASNRRILDLSAKFKEVKPVLGLYPLDALKIETDMQQDHDIDQEIVWVRQKKPIAIGEVGLDYKNFENKEQQKKQFQRFIELAKEINIPIIVHTRKAEEDAINMLEKSGYKKIVLHCFSGKKKLLLRARDNGWFFTVPTNVVRSEQHQIIAEMVPLSRLFCETDSPYLSPHQNVQNEPAFVIESYRMIANIKSLDLTEVRNNIFLNYQRLF